jgi:hypothetical protein
MFFALSQLFLQVIKHRPKQRLPSDIPKQAAWLPTMTSSQPQGACQEHTSTKACLEQVFRYPKIAPIQAAE